MTLPACFEPENARVTIPVLLAIGYALYHVWRWRQNHSSEEPDLPPTASSASARPQGYVPAPRTVTSVAPETSSAAPDASASPPDGADDHRAEAERLWTEARGKFHSEIPDYSTDWHYMSLLYKAAELGHAEAMSLLGDYAFLREELVEAFYWKLKVELDGGICRNPTLNDIIRAWVELGCDEESENVKAGFSEQQGAFARAVLCLKSGVDPRYATSCLSKLVAAGNADAKRFLKKGTPRGKTPALARAE